MTDTPDRGLAAGLDRIVEPIFYRTRPFPCSYLPDRDETRVLTEMSPEMAAGGFFDFLQHYGFRRSQRYLYRPVCEGCSACIPVRIPVGRFTPNRTMRKIWRLNSDLSAQFVPARATEEQFALFSHYQHYRHSDSDMAGMVLSDYRALIEESPVQTGLLELRDANGALWGCALTDIGADSLSAVYSFYAPEPAARSLGTQLILALVEECRARGLPYLYLGYWIEDCRKMAYKIRFHPLEWFDGQRWLER
ncbi:putative arginyl-tRNA--protein transferase [Elstera cyanobacteriorum]|uniref:Aspartate/glutamate leucyltransferase n=1 Tax=Elstera cyanobacteriorum TaxID=2022747 RepID=A0A255XNC5_9PROT|nr:arginyltransferase [Elstera cyanobacteriorum]OYQ18483.1 arginyltransferase [Elstera cyanobacteriorum]GFZ79947.1 putative arginyl-tRNA--protein transferase [Elstera cyanobacteriorum]